MQKSQSKYYLFSGLLLVGLFLTYCFVASYLFTEDLKYGDFGARDFVQFWSAYQASQQQLNIYDPGVIFEIQKPLGVEKFPIMMWMPPWLLILLSPLLSFSFSKSALLFSMASALVLLFSLMLCASLYLHSVRLRSIAFALVICSFPVWRTLYEGQVSAFIFLFLISTIVFLQKGRNFLGGVSASLLLLKPHLFFLVLILLVWWALKNSIRQFFVGLVGSVLVLSLLSFTEMQHFMMNLVSVSRSHSVSVPGVLDWVSVAPASALRGYVPSLGHLGTFLVPSASAIFYLGYLIKCRPQIDLKRDVALLTAASLSLAPYGWLYDCVNLILPVMVWTSLGDRSSRHLTTAFILLFASCLAWIFFASGVSLAHAYTWFAPLVTLGIFYSVREQKRMVDNG